MHTRYTLKLRLEEINSQLGNPLAPISGAWIMPFREEYPDNTRRLDRPGKTNLNAHELFNKFTADVIKINVVFTR